jgi:hypothetical protein
MVNNKQIILDPEGLKMLPDYPAIYAIVEAGCHNDNMKCRFLGETGKLKTAVENHFKPTEKNIDLRYFMLSEKKKILHYITLENLKGNAHINTYREWFREFMGHKANETHRDKSPERNDY